MKTISISFLFLLPALNCFAQNTIKVTKNSIPAKAFLDSTFTHLIVYDQNDQRMDSCVVSFDMVVEVPSGGYWQRSQFDSLINILKPVSYRNHCSYLNAQMKKAWKDNPHLRAVYFRNIYAKGTDKKTTKLPDFEVVKP